MTYKDNWLKKEEKIKKNNKKRHYLHFDCKISYKRLLTYLENPLNIEKHSFFPFIKDILKNKRYKLNSVTKERVMDLKEREIFYSSHVDTLIYSWYQCILEENYEKFIQKESYNSSIIAYRKIDGKCNIDFAFEVFEFIRVYGECTALAFDITNFFPTLNHMILLKNYKKIIENQILPNDHYKVFKSLTSFAYVEKEKLKHYYKGKRKKRLCEINEYRNNVRGLIEVNGNKYGIPQGSALSALLSNIYMLEFDKKVYNEVQKLGGLYRRYSDDIIVICPTQNSLFIKELIYTLIQDEVKLSINENKTDITNFRFENLQLKAFNSENKLKYVQYLGFEFDGMCIRLRSSSISKYYRRLKKRVSSVNRRTWKKKTLGKTLGIKKLYENNTHLGKRNFIKYAYRSAQIMNSEIIKKQVKNHWKILHSQLTNRKRI
mgnify:CR=1 FL=1